MDFDGCHVAGSYSDFCWLYSALEIVTYVYHTLMSFSSAVRRQAGLITHFLSQWRQLFARYSKLRVKREKNIQCWQEDTQHKFITNFLSPSRKRNCVSVRAACKICPLISVKFGGGLFELTKFYNIIIYYKH